MIAQAPPAAVAAAPAAVMPLALEAAFAAARASARRVSDPASTLASAESSTSDKLTAIDVLHSGIPTEPRAAKVAAFDALAAAAGSAGQPPEVRAKALTFLGYAMPQVEDDAARTRGLTVLLAALKSPAYRIFALRGLGPACHDLPEADDAALQGGLLDLLDGSIAGEERETALVALFSFVSTRDALSKKEPALVAAQDARLLAPIEADPARFAADSRFTPGARSLEIASIWMSARHRETLGSPAAGVRVHALLVRLASVETDPTVLGWIRIYRDAAPARAAKGLRARTTRRAPAGPEEP
jgi:hypothetical protein